ncbi:tryptophan synthase subunit beta like protein [Parahaliea sp. F7430]|uniref:Tryptophan synthase subunit beta like protein n=1 Tax=Sediminihaliea albiluteola TaxID=2758564 RepID=A0A7W2TYL5_9GAMM|nr:tryptophan synthase subunit beta like protein [Sediminihaliea albiluteola]MBA6414368.1 tryptophan synthase subunit beta like protein [Sediminihaliea albiluteola]
MAFIRRDDAGQIVAVSQIPSEGLEPIAAGDVELQHFLRSFGGASAEQLNRSDQDFVRVLEDLVELLIAKGVILFTELPDSAQQKVLLRQQLRSKLDGSLNLIGDD